MIKIQFLGTGAGIPSKRRNVSSFIIQMLDKKKACWLFDCGEATQHRLLHSSLSVNKINKIFISHLHGDHIYGLPGFLGTRSFQGAKDRLDVFGPKGLKEFIETTLKISNTYLRYPLVVHEIEEGIIFKESGFKFYAIELEHGIASYGYRIEESNKPGNLQVDKLKEAGISPGPIFSKIKAGEKVTLENGKVVDGREFIGPLKKGRVISVSGDTRQCIGLEKLVKNADILIHEATFRQVHSDLAFEHYHSTISEAANLAKKENVDLLFLSHISSRYTEETDELLVEAKSIFPNAYVAEDLETYIIKENNEVIIEKYCE